ncbi:MAG: hypothetical protein QG556_94 [Pseudomonadota bacterium]|nr:hypothetical protein [Pseudomonadota bacterium]
MNILNHLTNIGCLFNSLYAVLAILICFCYFKKYDLIYSLIIVSTTSALLNAVLKAFFKAPLMPHLGPGYAFPSGHAQLGMVLWGWLCIHHLLKKQTAFIIFIIAGFSMFYQNYHTPIEIIAGYITGLLVLILFHRANLFKYPEWLIIINCCLMINILQQAYVFYFYILYFVIALLFLFYRLLRL